VGIVTGPLKPVFRGIGGYVLPVTGPAGLNY
jgi:hypothetical protein